MRCPAWEDSLGAGNNHFCVETGSSIADRGGRRRGDRKAPAQTMLLVVVVDEGVLADEAAR